MLLWSWMTKSINQYPFCLSGKLFASVVSLAQGESDTEANSIIFSHHDPFRAEGKKQAEHSSMYQIPLLQQLTRVLQVL